MRPDVLSGGGLVLWIVQPLTGLAGAILTGLAAILTGLAAIVTGLAAVLTGLSSDLDGVGDVSGGR